jgi:hypothetical protein
MNRPVGRFTNSKAVSNSAATSKTPASKAGGRYKFKNKFNCDVNFEERSFVAALLRMTMRVGVAPWFNGAGGRLLTGRQAGATKGNARRRTDWLRRGSGRGGYVEEVGLEGVAADEEA